MKMFVSFEQVKSFDFLFGWVIGFVAADDGAGGGAFFVEGFYSITYAVIGFTNFNNGYIDLKVNSVVLIHWEIYRV